MDQIVAGTNEPKPPCVVADLPRLQGWLPGRVWAHWVVDPKMFHLGGAVFGGYLAALADQALGLATMTVVEDGEAFTTSDLRVSFFRPVARGSLHIEAQVVHRGHGMVQTEVVFTRDDGRSLARPQQLRFSPVRQPLATSQSLSDSEVTRMISPSVRRTDASCVEAARPR
jgi:uncharacterized protein (TIGR00369 family)